MTLRGGRKLSREEVEREGLPARGRGNLEEYEQTFDDLAEGEGYRYEIGATEKSINERSRWVAVAGRRGYHLIFKSRKDRASGQTTIEIVKGARRAESETDAGGARRGS
jgi:hypothetical protein